MKFPLPCRLFGHRWVRDSIASGSRCVRFPRCTARKDPGK